MENRLHFRLFWPDLIEKLIQINEKSLAQITMSNLEKFWLSSALEIHEILENH